MKQNVYPEIVRTLREVEELFKVENNALNGSACGLLNIDEDENPEKILAKFQKIHHLILKVKHKDVHNKLSEREKDIIQEICKGRTTMEISKIMNLSKHTIESHRTNIFSKLDVRNVAELVALAFRVGLVR